jgi:hypothetical protein
MVVQHLRPQWLAGKSLETSIEGHYGAVMEAKG